MTQWQPIATVPKDGTKVLLYNEEWEIVEIAFWAIDKDVWESESYWLDGSLPTHWMPFVPPEEANSNKEAR